ncbi:MAG: hypothetical protein FJZ01_04020 [Candidatus Sericytochromatia bacterium]|nr:hypothetical protein [Candidatus Tanganyikabacteria bacterium]
MRTIGRKLRGALLVAAAGILAGCVDLPVVGNVGEQIKPYVPEFIREKLYGPEHQVAETPSTTPGTPRRRRRNLAAPGQAAAAAGAPGEAAPAPVRRENVAALYEQYLTRNMEFDRLRTQAMEQLIAGQTDKAIDSLKQALARKPGDKSAEELLHLAQHPPAQRPLDGGADFSQGAPGMVPGLPGQLPPDLPVDTSTEPSNTARYRRLPPGATSFN